MRSVTVDNLTPSQWRRFMALSKAHGHGQRAAKLAFRVGILMLSGLPPEEARRRVDSFEADVDREVPPAEQAETPAPETPPATEATPPEATPAETPPSV